MMGGGGGGGPQPGQSGWYSVQSLVWEMRGEGVTLAELFRDMLTILYMQYG